MGTLVYFFSPVQLSEGGLRELGCWEHALEHGFNRRYQTRGSGTLALSWGDGSGTGTGGTFELISTTIAQGTNAGMEMWMGTWVSHVHHLSSNWRELGTLLATLEGERLHHSSRVPGRRVFYFTDNQVTYDLIRKGVFRSLGLQILILDIKNLEMELHCSLEVVHVPGHTMVEQEHRLA